MNATMTFGYTKLDKYVPNWSKARVVIVAGRPALGKTAFAVSLASNIAIDQKMQIAFFSMEESERELKSRFMSNICELDNRKINDNTLNEEEKAKYKKGLKKFNDSPILIKASSGLSVSDFSSKVNTYLPHRKRYSRNVPCMADIERVDNIGRESDVILLLHRPEFYGFAGDMPKNKGIAEIIVIKNIYGKKGSFLLGFIPEFSRFYNLV